MALPERKLTLLHEAEETDENAKHPGCNSWYEKLVVKDLGWGRGAGERNECVVGGVSKGTRRKCQRLLGTAARAPSCFPMQNNTFLNPEASARSVHHSFHSPVALVPFV